jgi:LPS-assembly lipoprotein
MSLFNRRSALLLLPGLAACTFAPAYAPGGPAANLQGAVRVDDPDTKAGFDLVERLEERLGRPSAPRYQLGYTITTKANGVAITPENAITRYHLTGTVDFTLKDQQGAVVTSGRVESFTAYSATGSTVAGLAAEEDASLRLMRILADLVVSRLLATSGHWSAR